MKARLFLADDDTAVRQSLAFVLRRTCNCEVVGEAANAERALRECHRLRPQVLVVDLRMPGMNGAALLRPIRQKLGIAVLVYTAALDEVSIAEAVDAEPEGVVLKRDELAVLRAGRPALCA